MQMQAWKSDPIDGGEEGRGSGGDTWRGALSPGKGRGLRGMSMKRGAGAVRQSDEQL